VLDHGTGGGVGARDLVVDTATEVATGRRLTVALVEQPYRATGRRSTPAAHLLERPESIASPAGPQAERSAGVP
jgi:uncharacterized protein